MLFLDARKDEDYLEVHQRPKNDRRELCELRYLVNRQMSKAEDSGLLEFRDNMSGLIKKLKGWEGELLDIQRARTKEWKLIYRS